MDYQGKPIDFMKHYVLYFIISGLIIVPGIYSLIRYGLRPAIDFTGGSVIEMHLGTKISDETLKANMPTGVEVISIQHPSDQSYIVKTKPISNELNELAKQRIASQAGTIKGWQFESVGPTMGKELLTKMVTAILLSAGLILLYVAYRFKNVKYGVSAVIAMFHDSLVVLGVFSLLGHFMGVEVDTLFITALLTILSFSVHDTIVVYDRIRESSKIFPRAGFVDLINKAVNETLARSINNSMTVIFMLLAMWLMGGETTKWFVFALLIGTVTGTYSSTFTAAPLLVLWERLSHSKKKKK
jgi:preprotein translocase subunit SecF